MYIITLYTIDTLINLPNLPYRREWMGVEPTAARKATRHRF